MKQPEPAVVEIEDIGTVLLKPSGRHKRISIQLKPFEGVEVLFPLHYPLQKAMEFVLQKRNWIIQSQKKIRSHEKNYTVFDENTVFRTAGFALSIRKASRTDVRLQLRDGILHVYYPEHIPVSHPPIQEAIRYGIDEAMRLEAKRVLPQKIRMLAAANGFTYKNVFVKNLKSRWGSCSFENNINLNLQLMRLPEPMIDYVLLHELCHTVEKNHGASFWKLLNKCTANSAKMLANKMKEYNTQIY
ncbi:MAG: M48 family metallopeptidase [Cytophagaceae bacterium]|nr:M48 family metallopeptidase [Cytophagaceae bacterium]